MILTGAQIGEELNRGGIKISPYKESCLGPNSYNVTLHNELLIYDEVVLDMAKANRTKSIQIPPEGLVLDPGRLYLGRTVEHTEVTGNLVPMLEGRSSIGRLGMFIHVTAGFGDIEFRGTWTLEIHVIAPLRVYAQVEVAQLYFHEALGDIGTNVYKGKYQDCHDIRPSRLYEELAKIQKALPLNA